MVIITPNDSNSSSSISTTRTQIHEIFASPQEAVRYCQFCSMRFLTLQGLGAHKQDTHSVELNLPTTEESPQPLKLEERRQALKSAIMRAQRKVLRTSEAMALDDGSSSSSYHVHDNNYDDDYIISTPNFVGSDVTLSLRPHAYGFGNVDETSTACFPYSTKCDRLFGICLSHLVRESYLMYPPPGFAPLEGESFIRVGAEAQEGEDETNGEVQLDSDIENNDNGKPLHEELDLTLKL